MLYIYIMKVETQELQTIKNYATKTGVTPSYIYKLEKEKKIQVVKIDGVKFIDIKKNPVIPTKK